MIKITLFLRILYKSLFSTSYYKDIVKARFSFSLKYFILFSLLLGLFITSAISIVALPEINKFISRLDTRVLALYPQDLVIEIKDGQLTTNAPEPLQIPIPYELLTDVPPAISDQKQTYLITIDTNAPIDDFKNYNSLIFANSTTMAVVDDQGSYRLYDLNETPNTTIDRTKVENLYNQVRPLLNYVPAVLILLMGSVFMILIPGTRLFSLLILTLIMLAAANIMNLQLDYKKVYQIGLHSLTLPTLIQVALMAFQINIPIPFFFSIMFILYNLVIFAGLKTPSTPQPAKITPPDKESTL